MAKVSKWPKRVRQQFLTVLEETGNVSETVRIIGRTNAGAYWLRRKDPEFAAAWDQAIEVAAMALEDEARRRAVEGYDEPVFHRGKLVGYMRRYSDRLLETLLRAYRPERFRAGPEAIPLDSTPVVVVTGIDRGDEPGVEEVEYRELTGRRLPDGKGADRE